MCFVFLDCIWFLIKTAIISLNSIDLASFVMDRYSFFDVRTEYLNRILTSYDFKALTYFRGSDARLLQINSIVAKFIVGQLRHAEQDYEVVVFLYLV
jgi:hypothetical protein